jgi:hypothetical protein
MKPLAVQRAVPLPESVPSHPAKKNALRDEIDVRRWRALKLWWGWMLKQGVELNLKRMSDKKGLTSSSHATQILSGHRAINVEWMMLFAEEMGNVPPQFIWKNDWPFPSLTPDSRPWRLDPNLHKASRRFGRVPGKSTL